MNPRMIVTASMLATVAAVFLLVAIQTLHMRTWGGKTYNLPLHHIILFS